jgi:hypothetical protein
MLKALIFEGREGLFITGRGVQGPGFLPERAICVGFFEVA